MEKEKEIVARTSLSIYQPRLCFIVFDVSFNCKNISYFKKCANIIHMTLGKNCCNWG